MQFFQLLLFNYQRISLKISLHVLFYEDLEYFFIKIVENNDLSTHTLK